MPRKGKLSAEEKMRIIEMYLEGKVSRTEACRMACVHTTTFKKWIKQYEIEGPIGLLPKKRNLIYDKQTKMSAVLDYLAGDNLETG